MHLHAPTHFLRRATPFGAGLAVCRARPWRTKLSALMRHRVLLRKGQWRGNPRNENLPELGPRRCLAANKNAYSMGNAWPATGTKRHPCQAAAYGYLKRGWSGLVAGRAPRGAHCQYPNRKTLCPRMPHLSVSCDSLFCHSSGDKERDRQISAPRGSHRRFQDAIEKPICSRTATSPHEAKSTRNRRLAFAFRRNPAPERWNG